MRRKRPVEGLTLEMIKGKGEHTGEYRMFTVCLPFLTPGGYV